LAASRILIKGLQQYWRLSRPLTFGAQGMVIDAEERVLLVRHTYRPGWHFPGGGVEKRETVEAALARELQEEASVVLNGRPELFGIYANFRVFPGDHIALFLVRDWSQPVPPVPNREIAEQRFFRMDDLPRDIQPSTHARIEEFIEGRPRAEMW
jgi:ADP-ribose pyrophosphatase YjhB (NUDIX family)